MKGLRTTWLPPALALGGLWTVLIAHLSTHWNLHPQYHYGWAVPFLTGYLVWKALRPGEAPTQATPPAHTEVPPANSAVNAGMVLLPALAWLPLRLAAEANPDWRLVSWALALTTIGLTMALLRPLKARLPGYAEILFALGFFLVSVPWPSFVENHLVHGLTRFNAGTAVEVLWWLGVPAAQKGHLIQIPTGTLGIDAACSGIRSLQATLMIALFLGGCHRLAIRPRVWLVAAGLACAVVFNLGRTLLLAWVAAGRGVDSVETWHDPAGTIILVLSFFAVWAGARWLAAPAGREAPELTPVVTMPLPQRPAVLLLSWLLISEAAVFAWYASRENRVDSQAAGWTVEWPTNSAGFESLPIRPATAALLRYDTGSQATWTEATGGRWVGFYFHWNAGRTSGYLAKRHTPESCMPAAGHELESAAPMRILRHGKLALPYRIYRFTNAQGHSMLVLHSRWENGVRAEDYATESPTAWHLIRSVWSGRGRTGQKSIQLILFDAGENAERLLESQLARILHPLPSN